MFEVIVYTWILKDYNYNFIKVSELKGFTPHDFLQSDNNGKTLRIFGIPGRIPGGS
jgi:hypothetical protein